MGIAAATDDTNESTAVTALPISPTATPPSEPMAPMSEPTAVNQRLASDVSSRSGERIADAADCSPASANVDA